MEIATTLSSSPINAMAKARKTAHDETPRRCKGCAMLDVLHLEMVMQRVLAALPASDLSAFLAGCGGARELAWLQEDATLWEELLAQHFGGRRHVAAEAQQEQEEAGDDGLTGGDDGDDDDEDSASEEEDEDDDEEENEDASDHEQDDDTATRGVDQAAPPSVAGVAESSPSPSTETDGTEPSEPGTTSPLPDLDMPEWVDKDRACAALLEFIVSLREWTQFQQRVVVVRGDIGTMQDVDGLSIDAIAFPGSSMMGNPYNGAASAVFRRAGRELDEHTRLLNRNLRAGECHVTPGFNSGARVLIHCHGPYNSHPRLYATLGKTYRNVLRKAKEENVACLAMTSISTGNFGVPIPEASKTAVRAIQQFMRAHHTWQGRVGIVCYEADVFEAFRDERQRLIGSFNAPTQ